MVALLFAFLAAWLASRGGGDLWLVAPCNAGVALVSLVFARFLPETLGRDLQVDEAAEPAVSTAPRHGQTVAA